MDAEKLHDIVNVLFGDCMSQEITEELAVAALCDIANAIRDLTKTLEILNRHGN